MDRDRTRPETPAGAIFHARLAGARLVLILLVPILLVASVALVRASGITTRPRVVLTNAVGATLTPVDLTAAAAQALEQAVAAGGSGYRFEIVQHGTLVQKPDGPPITVPDPADPERTIEVSSLAVGSYLERGSVTPAGFHAEIRKGPDDPTAAPDWAGAALELAALVRDGRTYRDDGRGWYETARPPGIGLDPATAGLLPTMLRGLERLTDASAPAPRPSASPEPGRAEADPFAEFAPARRLDGDTEVADIPGIIAVDLATATELRAPAELAFDDAGRLIGLRILARNSHLDRYDLLVETVVTFSYPDAAPELPRPEPRWVAPAIGE